MRRVIIESPFRGDNYEKTEQYKVYARRCMNDCIVRGEAPFASHLLYTQPGVLRDEVARERELGIRAGLEWGQCADATVVYKDYGVTSGMELGIEEADKRGRPIEERTIGENEG